MAETIYNGSIEAENQGDIVLDPRTRLGKMGKLEKVTVEVTEGADLVTIVQDPANLLVVTVQANTDGNAVVKVSADKNLDPAIEDDEVGIWNILITPAGTVAVPMTFANVRPI
jgi:hypothetical protein